MRQATHWPAFVPEVSQCGVFVNEVHASSAVHVASHAPAAEQTGADAVHPIDPKHCWHSCFVGSQ
jgi:hypothetical protein